jgi:hypothetical protein
MIIIVIIKNSVLRLDDDDNNDDDDTDGTTPNAPYPGYMNGRMNESTDGVNA